MYLTLLLNVNEINVSNYIINQYKMLCAGHECKIKQNDSITHFKESYYKIQINKMT